MPCTIAVLNLHFILFLLKWTVQLIALHSYVLSFLLVCPVTHSPLPLGCLETCQKCCVLPGHRKGVAGSVCHTGHVLALAVSSDDKFLVSLYYNTHSNCVGLRLQAEYAVLKANCCLGYMSPWLHERLLLHVDVVTLLCAVCVKTGEL